MAGGAGAAGSPATAARAAAQDGHRAAVAAGKQPADAAPDPAWSGLGMSPADAPLAAAAIRGQQADAALAAALLAAKSEASAAQERVRVVALTWERERERATADALALRVAEAALPPRLLRPARRPRAQRLFLPPGPARWIWSPV